MGHIMQTIGPYIPFTLILILLANNYFPKGFRDFCAIINGLIKSVKEAWNHNQALGPLRMAKMNIYVKYALIKVIYSFLYYTST